MAVDIRKFVDLEEFQKIQDLFANATGLAAIAVDAKGEYITKPSNFTDFCIKYTRGSQEGLRRCVKCDTECTGTYFCHAGLMDFSADLIVEGEKVGAIIGGQVLPGPPDKEKFREIARELGINEHSYLQALDHVSVRTEKQIRASADLLKSVMNQMINLEYFKVLNQKKIDVFNEEIQTVEQIVSDIQGKTKELGRVASMENILSINASIEAGRAGQAGVGFAVVAREIGDLSRSSAKTYEEIREKVNHIKASMD